MSGADRVVVVGASRAGTSVVATLRARGFSGSISLIGDEDVPPYDRTHLSKTGQTVPLCGPDDLAGIELRLGTRAVGLDTTARIVVLDDGAELPYDGLFVATGATPRWPAALAGCEGVHVLRTLADAIRLRAGLAAASRVLIVGGGFVGAEIAVAARDQGLPVTIVEAGGALLERGLGAHIGAEWTELHRRHGVTVHTGRTVVSLEQRDGAVSGAVLDDGRTVAADLVVVGVGAVPATGWLGDALPLDDGVVCDATLQAVPGVWAVGDVARWRDRATGELRRIEHWTNAHAQGRVAAGNFLGDDQAYATVPYVWSDQYGHRIQIYGTTHDPDAVHVLDSGREVSRLVVFEKAGRVAGAIGVDAAKDLLPWRRAIAQRQIWASELVQWRACPATTRGRPLGAEATCPSS